jgi:RNA polymerase sigma factor (sigma-70 family)
MSEQELIEGCLQRDRKAQWLLYERYKDAMYTLAVRICGDREVAAEVLQDAFLKVFHYLAGFEGRSTLGAWIKTIVVRTAVRNIPSAGILVELDQRHESVIDWGVHAFDSEYLEQAISALPEGCRTVFVLAEIEGFTHREIGEMIGIAEGTSKSQLFFAKKRLRLLVEGLLVEGRRTGG